MQEAVSITADFSCKISISGNFPPHHFSKERLYFQWSTEFTKGDSPEAKIDSKGDVKWQLKIDTTSDGTDDVLESLCTLKFFKVAKMGKDELIGEGVFNMTEKLKLNKDIGKCYLMNNSMKFLYLKTKKASLKNSILLKIELVSQILKCRLGNDYYSTDDRGEWVAQDEATRFELGIQFLDEANPLAQAAGKDTVRRTNKNQDAIEKNVNVLVDLEEALGAVPTRPKPKEVQEKEELKATLAYHPGQREMMANKEDNVLALTSVIDRHIDNIQSKLDLLENQQRKANKEKAGALLPSSTPLRDASKPGSQATTGNGSKEVNGENTLRKSKSARNVFKGKGKEISKDKIEKDKEPEVFRDGKMESASGFIQVDDVHIEELKMTLEKLKLEKQKALQKQVKRQAEEYSNLADLIDEDRKEQEEIEKKKVKLNSDEVDTGVDEVLQVMQIKLLDLEDQKVNKRRMIHSMMLKPTTPLGLNLESGDIDDVLFKQSFLINALTDLACDDEDTKKEEFHNLLSTGLTHLRDDELKEVEEDSKIEVERQFLSQLKNSIIQRDNWRQSMRVDVLNLQAQAIWEQEFRKMNDMLDLSPIEVAESPMLAPEDVILESLQKQATLELQKRRAQAAEEEASKGVYKSTRSEPEYNENDSVFAELEQELKEANYIENEFGVLIKEKKQFFELGKKPPPPTGRKRTTSAGASSGRTPDRNSRRQLQTNSTEAGETVEALLSPRVVLGRGATQRMERQNSEPRETTGSLAEQFSPRRSQSSFLGGPRAKPLPAVGSSSAISLNVLPPDSTPLSVSSDAISPSGLNPLAYSIELNRSASSTSLHVNRGANSGTLNRRKVIQPVLRPDAETMNALLLGAMEEGEKSDGSPDKPLSGRSVKREGSLGAPSREGIKRETSSGSTGSTGSGGGSSKRDVLGKDDLAPSATRKKSRQKDRSPRDSLAASGATPKVSKKSKDKEKRKSKGRRKGSESAVSFAGADFLPALPDLPSLPLPPQAGNTPTTAKRRSSREKSASFSVVHETSHEKGEGNDSMKYPSGQSNSNPTLQRRASRAGVPVMLVRPKSEDVLATAPIETPVRPVVSAVEKVDSEKALEKVDSEKALEKDAPKTPRALADWDKLDEYEAFMREVETDLQHKRQAPLLFTASEEVLLSRTETHLDVAALLLESAAVLPQPQPWKVSPENQPHSARSETEDESSSTRDRSHTSSSASRDTTPPRPGDRIAVAKLIASEGMDWEKFLEATLASDGSAEAVEREIDALVTSDAEKETIMAKLHRLSHARTVQRASNRQRAASQYASTSSSSSSSSSASTSSTESDSSEEKAAVDEDALRSQRFEKLRLGLSPKSSPRVEAVIPETREDANIHGEANVSDERFTTSDGRRSVMDDLYKKLNALEEMADRPGELAGTARDEMESGKAADEQSASSSDHQLESEELPRDPEHHDEEPAHDDDFVPDSWEAFVAQMLERKEAEGRATDEHDDAIAPSPRDSTEQQSHRDSWHRQNLTVNTNDKQEKKSNGDEEWDSYIQEVQVSGVEEKLTRSFDDRVKQVTPELVAVLQIAVKFTQLLDLEILKGLGPKLKQLTGIKTTLMDESDTLPARQIKSDILKSYETLVGYIEQVNDDGLAYLRVALSHVKQNNLQSAKCKEVLVQHRDRIISTMKSYNLQYFVAKK